MLGRSQKEGREQGEDGLVGGGDQVVVHHLVQGEQQQADAGPGLEEAGARPFLAAMDPRPVAQVEDQGQDDKDRGNEAGVRHPFQIVVVGVVDVVGAEDGRFLEGADGVGVGAGATAQGQALADGGEAGAEDGDAAVFRRVQGEAIQHRRQADGQAQPQDQGDEGAGEAEGVAAANAPGVEQGGQDQAEHGGGDAGAGAAEDDAQQQQQGGAAVGQGGGALAGAEEGGAPAPGAGGALSRVPPQAGEEQGQGQAQGHNQQAGEMVAVEKGADGGVPVAALQGEEHLAALAGGVLDQAEQGLAAGDEQQELDQAGEGLGIQGAAANEDRQGHQQGQAGVEGGGGVEGQGLPGAQGAGGQQGLGGGLQVAAGERGHPGRRQGDEVGQHGQGQGQQEEDLQPAQGHLAGVPEGGGEDDQA